MACDRVNAGRVKPNGGGFVGTVFHEVVGHLLLKAVERCDPAFEFFRVVPLANWTPISRDSLAGMA